MKGLINVDLLGEIDLLDHGVAVLVLAELALQVLEEASREDLDVSDLHGLEPDAPADRDGLEILDNLVLELLAVLDDIVNRRVRDAVSDDG